jgi:hypothetical protein
VAITITSARPMQLAGDGTSGTPQRLHPQPLESNLSLRRKR